jgi:hypothetical protein
VDLTHATHPILSLTPILDYGSICADVLTDAYDSVAYIPVCMFWLTPRLSPHVTPSP